MSVEAGGTANVTFACFLAMEVVSLERLLTLLLLALLLLSLLPLRVRLLSFEGSAVACFGDRGVRGGLGDRGDDGDFVVVRPTGDVGLAYRYSIPC